VKFVNKDDDNDDIDAMIQVRLYDTEENEFVDLETDEDDLEVEISLDEGETVEEKFLLELPVEDIDDSSDRYRLYVKVYEDGDEEVVCRDYEDDEYFKEVKIDKESYEVILKDLEVTTPVPCGEEVEVIVRAHNIGKNDEDKVMVTLFNSELDIDLDSREFSLDEGDSEKVTFSFLTPEDAEEKTYTLKAYTMYRYKESTEAYREESEAYELALKIEGNCEAPEDEFGASIDAELGSESVVAGEELVILGTLENTGEQETTYVLSVEGYDSWAELDDIEPRTITLEAGEQEDFEVTFMVKEDTEGENFFTIVAEFEDQEEEQEVSVVVEAVSDVTGEAIAEHLRKNWFIWVIVVINVILIIAIIIVARRIVAAR